MAKAPAFQFYANDFMDSTRLWDANAVGLYVRCMCIQWTHGGIPADMKLLARALHCDRSELEAVWPVLKTKFEVGEDGMLMNNRLEQVRDRQNAVSSKRSEAANARWIAHANASTNAKQKDIQGKVKEKKKVEGEVGKGVQGETDPQSLVEPVVEPFEALWVTYERYGSKAKARAYWDKLNEEERAAIIAKAPEYVRTTPGCLYRKQLEGWINPENRLWERPIVQREPMTPTDRAKATVMPRNSTPPTLRELLEQDEKNESHG